MQKNIRKSPKADNLDDLNNIKIDGVAIKDLIVSLVSKIGENIKLRRFKKILKENFKSAFYVHNKVNNKSGKIISVLKYNSKIAKAQNLQQIFVCILLLCHQWH